MKTDSIRIVIADDHAIVRQGLMSLLLDADDVEVVGEAGDGAAAVDAALRLEPDVVLMDVVMPGMDGARATAEIRARRPGARILALSGSDVKTRILATLRAGASGYVSKASSKEDLVEAIRRVHFGRPAMPAALTAQLLEGYPPAATSPEVLTRRETEVLRLVARGLSNQEIAQRAGISEATIRTHVGNVFGKLGVNNRVEATLCALRDGLTSLDLCLGFGEPAT